MAGIAGPVKIRPFQAAALAKKHKSTILKLIPVEGQSRQIPEFRARFFLKQGVAILVNGCIRFTEDTKNLGYNATTGAWEWRGRKSGAYGPQVMQASHTTR